MKGKNILVIGTFIFLLLAGFGCSDLEIDGTSRIQLKLVDEAGDYEKVNVEIIGIQYNSSEEEGGWKNFENPKMDEPLFVDLTELVAGNSLLLTDELVPAGMMKQIRLILGESNSLKIYGEEELIPLNTPSAQQSGLKLKLDTELESGYTYTYILDWNVQKSIIKAGNSGKYNLKPVIRVIADINLGSISGNVYTENGGIQEVVFGQVIELFDKDNLSVTTTETDSEGNFMFQGVDPSKSPYSLSIIREGYTSVTISDILVASGGQTELDPILLILN